MPTHAEDLERNLSKPVSQTAFTLLRSLIDGIAAALAKSAEDGPKQVLRRLFEQELDETHFVQPAPAGLLVLRYLPECILEAQLVDVAISENLAAVAGHLRWRRTSAHTDAVLGEGFTANYGWTQLIGPSGFFRGNDFLLGLLMLGPHRHYRDHFHPAPELYWPLTSGTLWRREPRPLTEEPAGTMIWHEPNQIHAMETCQKPLLALWAWTRDTTTSATLIA